MGLGSQYAGTFLPSVLGKPPAHFHVYLIDDSSPFKPINLFLASADVLFGPITTICANGRVIKKIPWSAFRLLDKDWQRVKDVKDILVVCLFACDAT